MRKLYTLLALATLLCGCRHTLTSTDEAHICQAAKLAGDHCYYDQRYIEALDFYTMALEPAQKCGNTDVLYRSMANIGLIYDILENHERALYYYERVYRQALQSGDNELAAQILANIVTAYCNQHRTDEARRYYKLIEKTPRRDSVMHGYYLLLLKGHIAIEDDSCRKAASVYRQALAYTDAHHMETFYQTPLMLELGNSYARLKMNDSAAIYYKRCEQLATENSTQAYLADVYKAERDMLLAMGNTAESAKTDAKSDSIEALIFNKEKLKQAQNKLYQTETRVSNMQINSLANTVGMQKLVIVLMVMLAGALVALIVVMLRQRKAQKHSYQLLIEKYRELTDQQQKTSQMRDVYLQSIEAAAPASTDKAATDSLRQADHASQQALLLQRIEHALDSPQLLFSPDFNMAMLCREVGSNRTYVSQVINEYYQKPFKTLLNERRIREATRRLVDNGQYADATIQTVALSLGYSSATSFIIAFKNIVGMTPAVYKSIMKKNEK